MINEYKTVVLGNSGVGKTCITNRFVANKYNPNGVATIGASFLSKTI